MKRSDNTTATPVMNHRHGREAAMEAAGAACECWVSRTCNSLLPVHQSYTGSLVSATTQSSWDRQGRLAHSGLRSDLGGEGIDINLLVLSAAA